ncbi:MAG: hypothetical protein A3C35_03505 [Omnitrophica bacterium RIFCSPHIGHO2_02_FULL_46_11]|nr:MAG: hypothetical protein A3C35_03505 [Omnitrophica bacterium RIFCSPHIGHO2_02_FULL_46_11]
MKRGRLMEVSEKKQLEVSPGEAIRSRRNLLGWRAIELARRSGINPGTLNAIEKGRIASPSLKNLSSIAKTLGISVAALFSEAYSDSERVFMGGNQKGQHILEFPKDGLRIVCYTPLVPSVFVGKVIVKGETRVEHRVLPTSGMIFVQVIMGKLSISFDGKDQLVREGNYAFFDGCFPHSYHNPHFKESTFLLVTAPSFLTRPSTL